MILKKGRGSYQKTKKLKKSALQRVVGINLHYQRLKNM
jgi:hypothetical protein